MKSNHCLTDIGEWSPFAIYQQRCRLGNWIYRIQYVLPNNNILTEKLMNMGLKCDYPCRDARRSYETWSQNLPQKDDLAWYKTHSTEVAKRHYTAPDVHKASKTCSAVINAMIEYSQGKDRLVDIPESLPGVPDMSCARRRGVSLPSPSVSGSDTSLCSGGYNLRRGSRRARCRCSRWRRLERTISVG
jgi:hypothetical protein